jgi:hypothetical protein
MRAGQFSLASLLLASTSAGIVAGHWRLIADTAASFFSAGNDAWLLAIPAAAIALAVALFRSFS